MHDAYLNLINIKIYKEPINMSSEIFTIIFIIHLQNIYFNHSMYFNYKKFLKILLKVFALNL